MIVEAWHLVVLFFAACAGLGGLLIAWGIVDRWGRDGWDGPED